MRDVPDEWWNAALVAYHRVTPHDGPAFAMRAALAAVGPLIVAQERERCTGLVDEAQAEVQANIDDNIAEVREVDMKPSDNWPLIRARDWLRHIAAAIRATPEGEK